LRLRQEAIKLEKSLAASSSPTKQQSTAKGVVDSPASSVSSDSSSDSPLQKSQPNTNQTEVKEISIKADSFPPVQSPDKTVAPPSTSVPPISQSSTSNTSVMREKLAKYGMSNFSSDEDDSDEDDDVTSPTKSPRTGEDTQSSAQKNNSVSQHQDEAEDMVMSFDNSFDDSF
jgi:hypothetical protein